MTDLHLEAMAHAALDRFYKAAVAAGLPIPANAIVIDSCPAPHEPPRLPAGKMAVYAFFSKDGRCLKCGKVGPNSNARYTSQHYNSNRAKSTLAASLLGQDDMVPTDFREETRIGEWMQKNLDRVNLLLPANTPPNILSFLEAFLHVCWDPEFEGHKA